MCTCAHTVEEHDPNGRCTIVEGGHQCACFCYREGRANAELEYDLRLEEIIKFYYMPTVNSWIM